MKTLKIAITGGIGSGKSTVANLIADMGFPVFSCDEIYKEVICDKQYIEAVGKAFPTAIQNGQIDRTILSNIVFSDKSAIEKLNGLSHPLIMNELSIRMAQTATPLVFAEVPLLFEGGFETMFDRIFIVVRDRAKRIEGLKQRNHFSEEEIESRFKNQMDYSTLEKEAKSNLIFIENNSTLDRLKENIVSVLRSLN